MGYVRTRKRIKKNLKGNKKMKNEIEKLLKSEDAYLKLNKFCTLHRWTQNAFGEKVDCLEAHFSVLRKLDYIEIVKSRTWREIVDEVCELQEKVFKTIADKINNNLKNGVLF